MDSERLPHVPGLAPKLRCWFAIMEMAGLVLLTASTTGCIIPTKLRSIPAEVNQPPAIIEELSDPPFGPLVDVSANGTNRIEFRVAAEDPNLDDGLHARMFILGLNNSIVTKDFIGVEDDNPSVDVDRPTLRRFTLGSSGFSPCRVSGPGIFAVIVADQKFNDDPPSTSLGLTDQNSWTITCE